MHTAKSLMCVFLLMAGFSSYAFELTALSKMLFKDAEATTQEQLQDAKFEHDVYAVLLQDPELHKQGHILVARNRDVVLIAGQASSEALRGKVEQLVLAVAHVKRTNVAVNHVAPINTHICGKAARTATAANDKRKFILKAADDCSSVNRFYNEIVISPPANEIQKSDDDVLKSRVVNELLRASIIQRADQIKVLVSNGQAYLLADQLTKKMAMHTTVLVKELAGVKQVIPLFKF